MRNENRPARARQVRHRAAELIGEPYRPVSQTASALRFWNMGLQFPSNDREPVALLRCNPDRRSSRRDRGSRRAVVRCRVHPPRNMILRPDGRRVFDRPPAGLREGIGRGTVGQFTGKSRAPRRSGQGCGGDGRSARAGWEMSREWARIRDCGDHQLCGRYRRRNAREFDRQLPLREEVADETVIRRILARPHGVAGAIRMRIRARSVGRARQGMEARPTKRDGRVQRDDRANQEMSNDSRHRNIVDE